MRAYPFELRRRAVELYKELGSYNAVAKILSVHHSWVANMVAKLATTGNLENNYSNCGRKPSIDDAGRSLLSFWLQLENDLILDELLMRLRQYGYECCRATVSNTLIAMHITRKKKRPMRQSKTDLTFGRSEKSGLAR